MKFRIYKHRLNLTIGRIEGDARWINFSVGLNPLKPTFVHAELAAKLTVANFGPFGIAYLRPLEAI